MLMLADMATLALVMAVAVYGYLWSGLGEYEAADYLALWPMLPLFVTINAVFRLYHGNPFYPSLPLSPVEEFRRLVASALLLHFGVMAILGFSHRVESVSRFVLLASAVGVAVLAQPVRDLFRSLMARGKVGRIRALVIGAVRTNAYLGLDPVPFAGELSDIVATARKLDIGILVCAQDLQVVRERLPELVKWFHHIVVLPFREAFPFFGSRPVVIGGLGGLEIVNQRRLKGLQHEKRVVDSLLAVLIGLVALPFLVAMPLLIKLTSRGPVLYKARRLGKNGRTIYVWKFRSMYADADRRLQSLLDSDPALKAEFEKDFKLKNDPRVTPLGRFMRKTSIDELPQLFNVLRGEMALVGPRPIVEKEVAYYGEDYEIFSLVKPGITGLWQASGRSDTDYAERVALDRHYVLNWSPWMDLWIVIKTVFAVLRMRGSY